MLLLPLKFALGWLIYGNATLGYKSIFNCLLRMKFMSSKERGHIQLEEESDSTYFLDNDFRFHQQLQQFHRPNYQTTLASYYADNLTGWALVLITLVLFIFTLFSGPLQSAHSTYLMFIGTIVMFITKVSAEVVFNSNQNFSESSLKNYALESKAVDIALFLAAWLAPFTDSPFISYFLLVPIGFILVELITFDKMSYPQELKTSRIIWSVFLVLQILQKFIFPDSLGPGILPALQFLLLPEILAFLCELKRINKEGWPKTKTEMSVFFYSQIVHSQRFRLCCLPIYSSLSAFPLLLVLVQNSFYVVVRNRLKRKIMLLKFIRNSNTTLIKLTSNLSMVVDSDGLQGGSEGKIQLQKESLGQDFSEELCCMCNNNFATYANGTCFHTCLCMGCRRKQKRKMERWTVPFGCPICGNEGDKHLEMATMSYRKLMRAAIGHSWEGHHLNSTYGFSYLA